LVLNLTFPPSFQGLTHLLGVLSLGSFGLNCLGGFDYVDYMYGITILTTLVLGFFFICFKRFEISRLINKDALEVDIYAKKQYQNKVAYFANMFIFMVLPAVTCAIFRMFPCQVWLSYFNVVFIVFL
jgi:hypothetical protein